MDVLANNIIVKGGWVMVPIILGSIIALGLSIERGMLLWKLRLDLKKFADDIFSLIDRGHRDLALEECARTAHPIGRIFGIALQRWGGDLADIEQSMEHAGNEEVESLEKHMHLFLVIVGVEPMLGFLGTIVGLIQAFMVWEAQASSITVDRLAAGIYQAMITTAGGLIVAIPFYIIYSVYTNRINGIARNMNHFGEILLQKMKNASRKRK
jgi:biopolymer transport protein ExbB